MPARPALFAHRIGEHEMKAAVVELPVAQPSIVGEVLAAADKPLRALHGRIVAARAGRAERCQGEYGGREIGFGQVSQRRAGLRSIGQARRVSPAAELRIVARPAEGFGQLSLAQVAAARRRVPPRIFGRALREGNDGAGGRVYRIGYAVPRRQNFAGVADHGGKIPLAGGNGRNRLAAD